MLNKTIVKDELIEKWVAVIGFRWDESVGENNGRISVQGRANLTKLTDMIEGRTTDIGDMFFQRDPYQIQHLGYGSVQKVRVCCHRT